MDFSLSEEHHAVQNLARDFAEKEVAPVIKEADRKQEMPAFILPRLGELGLLGLCIPVKYGGQGMDYITLGLVCEELDYVDISLRTALSVHLGLNSLGLLQWGTEEQKQRYLVPQAIGEKFGMFGLTEPGAGSDVANLNSTARLEDDTYVINGEKTWISLASQAHHILWFAKTETNSGNAGISAFIIETDRTGITKDDIHGKLGSRAGSTGWINCQDVRIPVSNRIGEEGEGFKIAMAALDQGRLSVAAGATGLIRACRDASVSYANERHTFGVAIGQHQLVKEMIAQMESDYQASRLLWQRSAWLKNIGRRNTRETGLAKWFSTVASERAAADSVQIHGANGYSDEYPVGRFYRNCKGAVIYEGTREIHKLMQADYALGYRVDKPTRCELPAYREEV